jgi:hypothetical protein
MRQLLLSWGTACAVLLVAPAITGAAPKTRSPFGESDEVVQAIAFTDLDGDPLTTPVVSVTGAYPGMAPREAVATISNPGNVPVGYDLFATVADTEHEESLADVLHVTIRRAADGEIAFRGRLGNLSVKAAGPLAAR